jgi:hypothetical protein
VHVGRDPDRVANPLRLHEAEQLGEFSLAPRRRPVVGVRPGLEGRLTVAHHGRFGPAWLLVEAVRRAVAPQVEHEDVEQGSVGKRPIDLLGIVGLRAQRHEFEEGLPGAGREQ